MKANVSHLVCVSSQKHTVSPFQMPEPMKNETEGKWKKLFTNKLDLHVENAHLIPDSIRNNPEQKKLWSGGLSFFTTNWLQSLDDEVLKHELSFKNNGFGIPKRFHERYDKPPLLFAIAPMEKDAMGILKCCLLVKKQKNQEQKDFYKLVGQLKGVDLSEGEECFSKSVERLIEMREKYKESRDEAQKTVDDAEKCVSKSSCEGTCLYHATQEELLEKLTVAFDPEKACTIELPAGINEAGLLVRVCRALELKEFQKVQNCPDFPERGQQRASSLSCLNETEAKYLKERDSSDFGQLADDVSDADVSLSETDT